MKRKFLLYQTEEHGFAFWGLDFLKRVLGETPTTETPKLEYVLKYKSELDLPSDDMVALAELYELCNLRHPVDYKTRSMSVSDIVVLDGKEYFVDSFGFELVKDRRVEDLK